MKKEYRQGMYRGHKYRVFFQDHKVIIESSMGDNIYFHKFRRRQGIMNMVYHLLDVMDCGGHQGLLKEHNVVFL